jgi:hypothetical protein
MGILCRLAAAWRPPTFPLDGADPRRADWDHNREPPRTPDRQRRIMRLLTINAAVSITLLAVLQTLTIILR